MKRKDGQRRVVQVISGSKDPVCAIVEDFYGSAVMNVITWDRAYCVFPHTTFVRRGMVVLRYLRGWRERKQVGKYAGRGFPRVSWSDEVGEMCQVRSVGDRYTWRICFDGDGSVEDAMDVGSFRFVIVDGGAMKLRSEDDGELTDWYDSS